MKLHPVDLKKIHINDAFWSKHVALVKEAVIPYQWDAINDRIEDAEPSHSLMNFKIAAGLCEGDFYGAVFQDTDVAKWLEAVGFVLAAGPGGGTGGPRMRNWSAPRTRSLTSSQRPSARTVT